MCVKTKRTEVLWLNFEDRRIGDVFSRATPHREGECHGRLCAETFCAGFYGDQGVPRHPSGQRGEWIAQTRLLTMKQRRVWHSLTNNTGALVMGVLTIAPGKLVNHPRHSHIAKTQLSQIGF